MLDISDNDLYELPDQLGDLSNLKSFILHDNELDLEETILKGVHLTSFDFESIYL